MHSASADSVVKALENLAVTSMWLQQDSDLEGWEDRTEQVDALLVSDVEYEVSHPDYHESIRGVGLLTKH